MKVTARSSHFPTFWMHLTAGVIVLCSTWAWSERMHLPSNMDSYTGQPYKVAFCFSFADDYEIPDNLRRRVVGEAELNVRKAFGKILVQSPLPRPEEEAKLQDMMAAPGIERLAAKDLAGLGAGLDRIVLVRITKERNQFQIAFREYITACQHLMMPVRTATCRSDLIAFVFAQEFLKKMCLEGYIESVDGRKLTILFKAQSLAEKKEVLLAGGDIYSIWNIFVLRNGEQKWQRLDWWFVAISDLQAGLIGGPLIRPEPDERYRVYSMVMREIIPGGTETLRIVSKKDPERGLPEYSVLATYTPPFDERRDLVGVTDARGEVRITDAKCKPLYVRVEKRQIIMKDEFVMVVRPHEGEKAIEVREFSEKFSELLRQSREIYQKVLAEYSASEQKRKAAESAPNVPAQINLLREAEALWPNTSGYREDLRKIEKEADDAGVDVRSELEHVREQMDEFDRKRPDYAFLVKELERVDVAVGLSGSANKLEAEAMEIWRTSLDWTKAIEKLEEAIHLAPDSEERRRTLMDSMRPKSQAQEAARRFVLEQLQGLTPDDLAKDQEVIKGHVAALVEAKDQPFLTRAVNLLSEHSSRVFKEAERYADMSSKAQDDDQVKKFAADSERFIALHETLSIIIAKMTEAMGSATQ